MSLMILGTASNVGKSTIVAAICRSIAKKGMDIAPFKSQNMSLNSYVTNDGSEIGIAQATQAFAAMKMPVAEMNPVLLKPKGDRTSQIILLGKPYRDVYIGEYYKETDYLLEIAHESYQKLKSEYGNVVVEGAGGAAEVNLYKRDIANILLAKKLNLPIIIVGDIERGGIFAQIIGTYNLLPDDVRKNVIGFIINKFRGDPTLFDEGIKIIEEKTNLPVIGLIPYVNLPLPSEDSLSLQDKKAINSPVKIAVIRLPRISNFSDFEMLENYASVDYISPEKDLTTYDCIIIPGTKNTVEDLIYLREYGFDRKIKLARLNKTVIIGICGGYQILGENIRDEGIESDKLMEYKGLGLLNITTIFDSYAKTTVQIKRTANPIGPILSGISNVSGYEIHMGRTIHDGEKEAFSGEGSVSDDGLVIGTYMHGLFRNKNVSESLLKYLYSQKNIDFAGIRDEDTDYENAYESLSLHFENNVNMDYILNHFS
ncbi:cobyric acid synthase [Methanoplanus sp. FWC-SCC4]|uniref:Probable cobyric acid synthase n=1 Tax=Methanochimaera problematica TaxID=2609417 RepID=A0AA97FCN4_9EURY|nr:cobyric acid synthase [Methanoplanus sp. FWC-SCC4]WOF15783.1 cobyric acid synthase [Methanoplanus sp. FWC-SCC4]